mgnify:CR=1 FL=1
MNNDEHTILTVCVRSYNQECYIAQALDSILGQKTLFPFEIIVSDDCSSDGTKRILSDYQQRYPGRIRILWNKSNIGGPRNLRKVIEASDAKYITCLDGDDYYLDKYKLQKQVDFLEENEDYAACFHNVMDISEKTGKRSLFLPLDFPSVIDARDVISKPWFLPIHSVMMRREFIFFPDWYETVMNDDYVVNLSVVMHGPYYYMPDVMVAYRHHDSNVSLNYSDLSLINGQLCKILKGFSAIYSNEFFPIFENRIKYLQGEAFQYSRDRREPWRKWGRAKTYKRILKRVLRRFIA